MEKIVCAVCENVVTRAEFEQNCGWCQVCNWLPDVWQEENPDESGSNINTTFNEAKAAWLAQQAAAVA